MKPPRPPVSGFELCEKLKDARQGGVYTPLFCSLEIACINTNTLKGNGSLYVNIKPAHFFASLKKTKIFAQENSAIFRRSSANVIAIFPQPPKLPRRNHA